ncbi:MAG TPA: FAD-binding protein [Bryobacteraceae bacterium]|nr:FAD-binding protein [Bryobacteraceae bacterium]
MQSLRPETPEQLAEALRDSASRHRAIRLGGNFSKDRLGGPIGEADVVVSTSALGRLLCYDPRDLTISVEAGMPWSELERTLAEHRQMLPLDPPWRASSTVGGVIAANLSGPRRRLYGTARDMIIGMTFATLEGKRIQSGGMVVKNVAGLDMAKLMVGSFGTLAAIAIVNFKVVPAPVESRTFVLEFATAGEAFAERDRVLRGVLQPSAIDIVNWPSGFRMWIQAGGSAAVLDRFSRELAGARSADESAWDEIREFTPEFLAANPRGAVVPIAAKLTEMSGIMANLNVPAIARAGSGVIYAHYAAGAPAVAWSGDFAMMEKVKNMFDPERLLNRGRLHGRI